MSIEEKGGVRVETRDETWRGVHRSVRLRAPCPEFPGRDSMEVLVDFYSNSPNPESGPKLTLLSTPFTRKQWELAKQLADQAWNEYEQRFGGQR